MFKPGDRVIFCTNKNPGSQRDKLFGKVITLANAVLNREFGATEAFVIKEIPYQLVRNNEIRHLTKLELVLN